MIDALVDRVRVGERVNLLEAVLDALDWSSFTTTEGESLDADTHAKSCVNTIVRNGWISARSPRELLSTEFMTEQRARGDM